MTEQSVQDPILGRSASDDAAPPCTRVTSGLKARVIFFIAMGVAIAVVVGFFVWPRPSENEAEPHVTSAEVVWKDTDVDGIPDPLELSGWATENGHTFQTDPYTSDTDGDGLSDGMEAGRLVSGSQRSSIFEGISDPLDTDSDGDTLGDGIEVMGWAIGSGERFTTDPMNPDSDGDGLYDGDEAGEPIEDASLQLPVYSGYSNPTLDDSDGDNLGDAAEADSSTDPFKADTDGDGLDDATELLLIGSDPSSVDTDGDGFDDGYEEANRGERGLDPLFEDVEVSRWDYATDFAQGAVAGELMPGDSVAWLTGNIIAGGASFIPGVGWIVGGVADIRDAVGSMIQADWVGAGFSAAGLVPVAGDAAAIPRKVGGVC